MRAVITVGISASGKSTYAAELVAQGYYEINRDWIRFNVVDPGGDWRTYKFNGKNEKQVSEIHGQMIVEAWSKEQDIVISDTNLNARRRNQLTKQLNDLGYDVEIIGFPISREAAVKRDNYRLNGVGQDVIYRQYQEFLAFSGRKVYTPDESLPKAIIVDVDGTVADMKDYRTPFQWDKVDIDDPREFVIEMVRDYSRNGYKIIFVSGRSDECAGLTKEWLDRHVGERYYNGLFMRMQGDFRKDTEIKEQIFWENLAENYNIVACIDDRPMMIRRWHELKIPNVIAVADPYLEF
jgi:predicted kinase